MMMIFFSFLSLSFHRVFLPLNTHTSSHFCHFTTYKQWKPNQTFEIDKITAKHVNYSHKMRQSKMKIIKNQIKRLERFAEQLKLKLKMSPFFMAKETTRLWNLLNVTDTLVRLDSIYADRSESCVVSIFHCSIKLKTVDVLFFLRPLELEIEYVWIWIKYSTIFACFLFHFIWTCGSICRARFYSFEIQLGSCRL